jgi:hypothetical protein
VQLPEDKNWFEAHSHLLSISEYVSTQVKQVEGPQVVQFYGQGMQFIGLSGFG